MAKKDPVTYPFLTRNEIVKKLESDNKFVLECFQEVGKARENKLLTEQDSRGFMASHLRRGTELLKKVQGGESLSEEEMLEVQKMTASYAKQLAKIFRRRQVKEDPKLADTAKMFSAS